MWGNYIVCYIFLHTHTHPHTHTHTHTCTHTHMHAFMHTLHIERERDIHTCDHFLYSGSVFGSVVVPVDEMLTFVVRLVERLPFLVLVLYIITE